VALCLKFFLQKKLEARDMYPLCPKANPALDTTNSYTGRYSVHSISQSWSFKFNNNDKSETKRLILLPFPFLYSILNIWKYFWKKIVIYVTICSLTPRSPMKFKINLFSVLIKKYLKLCKKFGMAIFQIKLKNICTYMNSSISRHFKFFTQLIILFNKCIFFF
jgi:hypothetical protein